MWVNVRYQIESGHIGVPLWYESSCVYQPEPKIASANKKPAKVFELEGRLLFKLARRHPELNTVA